MLIEEKHRINVLKSDTKMMQKLQFHHTALDSWNISIPLNWMNSGWRFPEHRRIGRITWVDLRCQEWSKARLDGAWSHCRCPCPGKAVFHSLYHSQLGKENVQHIWDFMDCKNFRDEDNLNLRIHAAAAAASPPPGFWALQYCVCMKNNN